MSNNTANLKDDKFYEDLDQEKSHQSCCSCQTMALFFLFILFLLIGGVFYFYYQFTSDKIVIPNLTNNFSASKISDQLIGLKPDELGQVQIKLGEKELTTLLAGGLSFQNFILKDVQANINPDEIIIYGSLIKPLNSKVVIGLVPHVENNKIKFEVKSIQSGKIQLPEFIIKKIGQNLNDSINTKFSLIYLKINVQEVFLEDHTMTIKGDIK